MNTSWDESNRVFLAKECDDYLQKHESSIDTVEEGDDGVFFYEVCSNNAEKCWEVELPERFNVLFK
jgi:hypothetical protein